MIKLIDKLYNTGYLDKPELTHLLSNMDKDSQRYLHQRAREKTDSVFGRKIYIRGLIEFTNYCTRNCKYCGIRKNNTKAERYRLSPDDIIRICDKTHKLGIRTFVLQGGEDSFYHNDQMTSLVKQLHELYPDTAITLSIGERSNEIYKKLYDNGADRFLLRHETISPEQYDRFHPNMSFENRIRCLKTLKRLKYQTGTGFLIGLPGQKITDYADDLLFIKELEPHMVGIGPFISHKDTPLKDSPNGSANTTLIMLSIIRLILPGVLLPSSTALNTTSENGAYSGFEAGANVLMINLTPPGARENYNLYEGKTIVDICDSNDLSGLKEEMKNHGYVMDMSRGDYECI